jgi:S-adenosylmethionine hydrolase
MGAYILASAAPYFPKNTIHVLVIDPGVGTKRKPLLIQGKTHYYIGPDNGSLALAVNNDGPKNIYEIKNWNFTLTKISNTFHGRDVFASVAAHLSKGVPPKKFGEKIYDFLKPNFSKIKKKQNETIGEIIHIDDFGNIITNFSEKEYQLLNYKKSLKIKLKDKLLNLKLEKNYCSVKREKPLVLIGGHNFLEIAINQGNAAKIYKIKVGDKVTIYNLEKESSKKII